MDPAGADGFGCGGKLRVTTSGALSAEGRGRSDLRVERWDDDGSVCRSSGACVSFDWVESGVLAAGSLSDGGTDAAGCAFLLPGVEAWGDFDPGRFSGGTVKSVKAVRVSVLFGWLEFGLGWAGVVAAAGWLADGFVCAAESPWSFC